MTVALREVDFRAAINGEDTGAFAATHEGA